MYTHRPFLLLKWLLEYWYEKQRQFLSSYIQYTRCPFYHVPKYGSFISQKACIRRDIPWKLSYLGIQKKNNMQIRTVTRIRSVSTDYIQLPFRCTPHYVSLIEHEKKIKYRKQEQSKLFYRQLDAQTSFLFTYNTLTLRWLMSYIYGAPILDVSRSHTTTQHSR